MSKGSLIITVGGNNSDAGNRGVLPWNPGIDTGGLDYTITLSGGPGDPHSQSFKGEGSARFLLSPGRRDVLAEVYLAGTLVAHGFRKGIEVKAGENDPVTVTMSKQDSGGEGPELSEIESPNVGALLLIPAGTFTMGSPTTETGRGNDETQHSVTLTKVFYMGKYEVTQAQYKAVMGNNPSYFDNSVAKEIWVGEIQENRPVEQVSWYGALVFCNTLSIKGGLTPAYSIGGSTDPAVWGTAPVSNNATWDTAVCNWNTNGYRLPTEAEREYACRAGTTTAYNTEEATPDTAGWYLGNSGGRTHEAGKKQANRWGLYDMHGNVHEWCWDRYETFTTDAKTDPVGASAGTNRVDRGGSVSSLAEALRSARRGPFTPDGRESNSGFRLVRNQ